MEPIRPPEVLPGNGTVARLARRAAGKERNPKAWSLHHVESSATQPPAMHRDVAAGARYPDGLLARLLLCSACAVTLASFLACARNASFPGAGGTPPGAEDLARIEQEVRDLEARFNGSYERNDMDAYWAFYADDLTQLWDEGRVSLEKYKQDWTAMLQAGGAVLEARMDDVQVRVSPMGDAAVASYRIFVRLRGADGKETSSWYHETDTWLRRDGEWKVVALHYSAAGGAQTPAPVAALRFRPRTCERSPDACGSPIGEL